jgi:methionyl-tRNA formyltransferase
MRVVFVTQLEEIHSSIVLKDILKSRHKVVGVVTSKTLIHKKNMFQSMSQIIRKSGIKYFIMRVSEVLYIKYYLLFKAIGIDKFKDYQVYTVKDIINKHNIGQFQTIDINSSNSLKKISELKPDIIICCVFNQIFKKKLLNIPRYGCINIHRSLLPDYMGVSPTFWVLANNENFTGVTIHHMTEKIDIGAILAQDKEKILDKDTVNTLSFRLMKKTGTSLVRLLDQIDNKGKIKTIQGKSGGKYYGWPTRESVNRFLSNKRKVF